MEITRPRYNPRVLAEEVVPCAYQISSTVTTCPRPHTTWMARRRTHSPYSKEQGKGSDPFELQTNNMSM